MKNKIVKKKAVFLKSYGCQMNVRDSEVVAGLLKQHGYSLVDDAAKSDITIFNTCSVRQHAEDKVWSEIGRIAKLGRKGRKDDNKVSKSQSHKPIIGLIGCMAQNYKEQVFERAPEVDFAVGPSDIDKIPGILARVTKSQSFKVSSRNLYEMKVWETDGEIRPEEIYHTGYYEDKDHAYVVISEGCSNFCSYCVVPFVRGQLHNRSHIDIIKEIEQAVARGITKITLLGQNVNAYRSQGHKVSTSQVGFSELLKMVNQIQGLREFSFITSHPKDTSVELFKTMAECEKLRKYLHLPVQSGSDSVLEKMNRGYTRKFYLDLVKNYRTIVTGGMLTTDIIVGFPGETLEDYKDTVGLVRTIEFDAAYIFKYSPRPNTAALKFCDDVTQTEKEKRHAEILALQKEISLKKRKK